MDKQVEQIHEELDNLLNSCGVHTDHIHKDFLYVVARHFVNWQREQMVDKACKEYCKQCDTKECEDYESDTCNWLKKFKQAMKGE